MRKRFEALDAFRGICAIAVAIFHMHLVGSITELSFFRGSAILVDFFFVLSGFVLAHGYGFRDDLKFYPFMRARFFRLYPLHFFMFVVFFGLEILKYIASEHGGIIFNDAPFTNKFAPQEIIPNLTLIHAWLPWVEPLSFNYPSWSISIEFYLYVILVVSMILLKSRRILAWVILSLSAAAIIASKVDFLTIKALEGLYSFFGGACAYAVYRKISHWSPSFKLGSILELLLLIMVIWVVRYFGPYKLVIAPAIFIVTVMFFAFESGAISKLLKIKPLQIAGTLSYSIYMVHAAILFCLISSGIVLQKVTGREFAPIIENQRYLDFGSALTNNLVLLISLLVILVTSTFTYKYVEGFGQKLNKKYKTEAMQATLPVAK